MIKLLSTIDDPFEGLTTRFCRPNKILEINGQNYIYFGREKCLAAIPCDYYRLIETLDGPVFALDEQGNSRLGKKIPVAEFYSPM